MEDKYSSKISLWEDVVQADKVVPTTMIEKLASTMDSRLLEVTIKNKEPILANEEVNIFFV